MCFGKRRNALLRETGGEVVDDGQENVDKRKKHSPPLGMCMQLTLLCMSVVILFFGVAVTLIGFWSYQSQDEYISITDKSTELTRVPLASLVTGIFVVLSGIIGLVGSIFSRTIMGQTLLGSYLFVMVLLIISEVAAGVAAVRLKGRFEDEYIESAYESQMMYGGGDSLLDDSSTASEWDEFQQAHKCCGAEGYLNDTSPYYFAFGNDSVPTSCCRDKSDENCVIYAEDAIVYREHIYEKGCPDSVVGLIRDNLLITAVISLAAGGTQLVAVLTAVVLLYVSSKLTEKMHEYKKLAQLENS